MCLIPIQQVDLYLCDRAIDVIALDDPHLRWQALAIVCSLEHLLLH